MYNKVMYIVLSEGKMKDGFIKVAAASVEISVANPAENAAKISEQIARAESGGAALLALPELCITGYTCGDLFFSKTLLDVSLSALQAVIRATEGTEITVAVGIPLRAYGKLYNCAVVIQNGKILGVPVKTHIPNYGEFYEKRHFESAETLPENAHITLFGQTVPMGNDIIFRCREIGEFTFGVEICEDVWAVNPPSERLCRAGAEIILNLSASDEVIGKADYRRTLISSTAARLNCGYIYSCADSSESTQDMVFSRHMLINENGSLLAENPPFGKNDIIFSETDVFKLAHERQKSTSFVTLNGCCRTVEFSLKITDTRLTRTFPQTPFVPSAELDVNERAEAILTIQSYGLKKRIAHAHAATAVIGISGGLDSTLALLVAARAMRLLGRPTSDILAVTMPCFGTTARTRSNAVKLCEILGVTLRTVDITAAVKQHFEDIGQNSSVYDVTFENSQARERTQVLMDIANKTGGMVIGTGDLSELALGWATYNGDHMSMYGVNCSVPKTLVRYIVRYEAAAAGGELETVLNDILDTPVSPELLPVDENGEMTQPTEDLVGPYELHDFFLYHMLRFGETPSKIYRLARYSFGGKYDGETVLKWLRVFTRRFFNQQFKRSCVPDGPKVGSVTLSPRGDWRMPSDASADIWLREIENLKP